MKTALIGEDSDGLVIYNAPSSDLARHYGFQPRECRAYRAKTKGKVERPIQFPKRVPSRRWLAGPASHFANANAICLRQPIKAAGPDPVYVLNGWRSRCIDACRGVRKRLNRVQSERAVKPGRRDSATAELIVSKARKGGEIRGRVRGSKSVGADADGGKRSASQEEREDDKFRSLVEQEVAGIYMRRRRRHGRLRQSSLCENVRLPARRSPRPAHADFR